MKITKFNHSCILIETNGRVALFDPGTMSTALLSIDMLPKIDDLFISHIHGDHFDKAFVVALYKKYPQVRITTTQEVADVLATDNVIASVSAQENVMFFESPHENVSPLAAQPQEIGIHYLDTYTHPGDSHSFKETKRILALPVTAPWGSAVRAINLALDLKPQHIIPIHDWHWRDEAREQMYNAFETIFQKQNIIFHKMINGVQVDINI